MLTTLRDIFKESEIGEQGIGELVTVFDHVDRLGLRKAKVQLDITLARGLNYYTGAIFEVVTHELQMGSICGGGRYDDLTGVFGLPNMSGVGISFGADRIYDVLNELKLWPEGLSNTAQILFVNFGAEEERYCLDIIKQLRDAGLSCEIYPEAAKMKKQMKYADDKGFSYVAIIGRDEIESGQLKVKEMSSGDQRSLDLSALKQLLV